MEQTIIYWLKQIFRALGEISSVQKNQADWEEADETAASYIKNKPTIPSAPIIVEDITALTKDQLDSLECGDVVIKVTGKQRHTYIVSYKGDGAGEGICLSYNDAGYGETVSYDRSGNSWVYNSTDIKTYGE